jgi:hypothetical protein
MAIGLVTTAYVLFATLVLRPWLTRRMEGRSIPKASGPLALTLVVVSGVVASVVGQAVHSVIAGLLAFAVTLPALSTVFILRQASRPPG